jgi:uncharacterized protein (UPF0261 family)
MPVLLIGTLDTKGAEFAFVRDRLQQAGLSCLVADASVLGDPQFRADIAATELFAAAGVSRDELRQRGDRGEAITAAARGAIVLAQRLLAEGRLQGVLGLGGSAGTTIATAAMRALPFGLPKVMVSTLASGQVRPYVGVSDIAMFHPVVDLSGLNRLSRTVLANAAAAMVGMVQTGSVLPTESDRPLLGATMFGVTTPCVEAGRTLLERAGYEVLVFHAVGTGGQTLETFVRDGLIRGVLDVTTTELADELVGGVLSAGPDRLEAAGRAGIPQVVSVGALDMVNFGPRETVPAHFQNRRFYQHNPNVTLMRTTPEENDQLGRLLADKVSRSTGPAAVFVPLRGVSALDCEGQPFWWPEADAALFAALRSGIREPARLVELDLHINDPAFAEAMAGCLLEWLQNRPKS